MSRLSTCPTPAEIQRLATAGGTPDEIEGLAVHLETCEACGEILDRDLAADPTLAGLADATAGGLPTAEQLRALRESVSRLRPIAKVAGSDHTKPLDSLEQTLVAQVPADVTAVAYSFLRPAEQAGELGRLGNYRVLQQIGSGGMGMVFLAEDLTLHRKVALKTMLPALATNAQVKERFLREARAAASVEHENIVSIFQVGEELGVPYLAMPLLKGEPLDERLRKQGRLELDEAVRVAAEVAAGLAAAHSQGLIHRDVKPANIWLEGESGKVKLLDFGLARAQADTAHLTQAGAIVGTPAFMAPEQAQGETVDPRADLFSLGAVLYLMLTGQRPFPGKDAVSVIAALVLKAPPAPQSINPEIPQPLCELTMQLLEKDPARRPESALVTVHRLRSLLESSVAARQRPSLPVIPAAAAVAGNGGRSSKKSRGPFTRLVAVGAAALAVFLAVAEYRIQTNTGELVLEALDEAIEVTIKQAGKKPVVIVVDKQGKREVELTAVGGEIEARELPDGLRFKTQRFELSRGGKPVFTADMLLAKAAPPARAPVAQAPAPPAAVAAKPAVYVESPEFTAWKNATIALPAEEQVSAVARKLKELNPQFSGRVQGLEGDTSPVRIEDGVVTEMYFVTERVTDIAPVRALTKLRQLVCHGGWERGQLTDLLPLQGMQLKILRVIGNPVRDLTPLQGLPLQGLELTLTPVSDLTPLKGVPLKWLMCGGSKVADLSPLKGGPLEFLECPDCPIKDFSPLQETPVRAMKIRASRPEGKAEAYSTLRSLKTLITINDKPADLFFAQLPGLQELGVVLQKLKELNPGYDGEVLEPVFDQEHVTSLRIVSNFVLNLSPLRELKGLQKLEVSRNFSDWGKLADISQLEGLPLVGLNLMGQPISDITPLKGMPLTSLTLGGSNVKDITSLEGMPLTYLHLGSTRVEDLSPLKGMRLTFLDLFQSPVVDLEPLSGMPLRELGLSPRLGLTSEVLSSLKSLENINGKPAKLFFTNLPAELEWREVARKLQELNLEHWDPRGWTEGKVENARVIEFSTWQGVSISDIQPLKALQDLTVLRFHHPSPMTDLSPLAGIRLKILDIRGCRASDLSPLKGMPLTELNLDDAPVTDLSPLAELPLIALHCNRIELERDGAILRSIKTLQRINGQPAAAFLKSADK